MRWRYATVTRGPERITSKVLHFSVCCDCAADSIRHCSLMRTQHSFSETNYEYNGVKINKYDTQNEYQENKVRYKLQ